MLARILCLLICIFPSFANEIMIHGRLTFKLPPSVGQTEPEIFELVHWMCSGLQKLLLSGVIPPQGPGEASAVNSVWRLTFEFDSIAEEALRLLREPVLAAEYRCW